MRPRPFKFRGDAAPIAALVLWSVGDDAFHRFSENSMISVGIWRLLWLAICICVLTVRNISRAWPAIASPRLGSICSVLMSFSVSHRTSLRLLAVSDLITVTACVRVVLATA